MLAAAVALSLWAHNDFEHSRPLFDALAQGACAVEADVHLQDGELRVAHRFYETTPGRTLEKLYLEPLAAAKLPDCAPFLLSIDFKSKPEKTLAAVERALAAHKALLAPRGKIRVLLSGSIPKKLAASRAGELYALDGRPEDIGRDPKTFPVISAKLPWHWPVSAPDLIARAHAAGHKVRFWGLREEPWALRALVAMGVDYLCVDNIAAARAQ